MTTGSIQLIVGLGNPGTEYQNTRHNAGFNFVDLLSDQYQGQWQSSSKYTALTNKINIQGHTYWLLKPMTYMNLSGQSVGKFANFYQIESERILIVHDELDIPCGQVRLKKGGGAGGHNGLKSIIEHLGNNKNFGRIRIGIDHPGSSKSVSDHVLSKPSASEKKQLNQIMQEILSVTPQILAGEWSSVMNTLHQITVK